MNKNLFKFKLRATSIKREKEKINFILSNSKKNKSSNKII